MRRTLAVLAAFGLASCDVDRVSQTLMAEANKTAAALTAPESPAAVGQKPAGAPASIAVVTSKSVPQYAKDLDHCQTVVAVSMGPPGARDDVEAVRRALKEHPHDKIISPVYINNDRAIRRREQVKTCLSRIGYLVE